MHFKITKVLFFLIVLSAVLIFEVKSNPNVIAVNTARKHIFGFAATTSGVKLKKMFSQVYDEIKNYLFNATNEDNMIATSTTTTIKPELIKLKPNFTDILSRKSRQIPPFLRKSVKVGGWAASWVAISTASSLVDSYIKEKSAERVLSIGRARFDCKKHNYGCIQNLCWSNCGPRIASSDWCVTSNKNVTTII